MASIPVDKSPAERARIKLIEYIAIMVVFNAALAGFAIATNGKGPINWSTLAMSATAQGVLAGVAALSKYFKASGQPLLSDLLDQARDEGAKSAPSVALSVSQDQLRQTVEDVLQAYLPLPTTAATQQAEQGIVKPQWMQELSKDPPVQQPEAPILSTLPNLAVVQPPPVS